MKPNYTLSVLLLALISLGAFVACPETDSSQLPSPIITSVNPSEAAPGDAITIKGNNFGNDSNQIRISIDGQVGAIQRAEPGQVTITLPLLEPGMHEMRAELGERKSVGQAFKVLPVKSDAPNPADVNANPDPITFQAIINAEPNIAFETTEVTINGLALNQIAAISIENGEYKLNGSAWVNSAATVQNGTKITVRGKSNFAFETTSSVKLNVGRQTAIFSIITRAARKDPLGWAQFSFVDKLGEVSGPRSQAKHSPYSVWNYPPRSLFKARVPELNLASTMA